MKYHEKKRKHKGEIGKDHPHEAGVRGNHEAHHAIGHYEGKPHPKMKRK